MVFLHAVASEYLSTQQLLVLSIKWDEVTKGERQLQRW